MPHCHPEQPTVASSAEAVVWDALRGALPDDAAMFADVRLTDGTLDCAADLVVAVPGVGIAVIEVAGGHVAHDDGAWTRTDAAGIRAIDPVGRAQRAHRALLDYLGRHSAWSGSRPRTAHLVAFPFATVPDDLEAAGCPRRLVLDHTQLAHPLRWLREAFAAPSPQEADPPGAEPQVPSPPTAATIDDLTECLLGRPPGQGPLLRGGSTPAHGADLLTESQAAVLAALRDLRVAEVCGGAGSGKTWLAVEQARRLTAGGARVGLLARSPGLVRYLQRRTARLRPAERPALVGSFDDLAALDSREDLDELVVDEAEQLPDETWAVLLSRLEDGSGAGLHLFTDDGRRPSRSAGRPPLEPVRLHLQENLRSTRPIARTFSGLGGARTSCRGGGGAPVRFVQTPAQEAVAAADDAARALLESGWRTRDVALLTTGAPHPVHRERLEVEGEQACWESLFDGERPVHAQVVGFQGLERAAVVLAVDGFADDAAAREVLYVGLSRARDLLVVCGDLADVRAVAGDAVARRLSGAGMRAEPASHTGSGTPAAWARLSSARTRHTPAPT